MRQGTFSLLHLKRLSSGRLKVLVRGIGKGVAEKESNMNLEDHLC